MRTHDQLSLAPEGWDVRPLKRAARINRATLPDNTREGFEFRYIDISAVQSNGRITLGDPMTFGKAPSRARRVVAPGDTIISTVRTYLKAIGRITAGQEGAIASTGFAVLTPRIDVDADYLWRFVQSDEFVGLVQANSIGIGYPSIGPSELGALSVFVPPLGTQRAIASFLDQETARLDRLIEKKRQLLDLLEEKREALLNRIIARVLGSEGKSQATESRIFPVIPQNWEMTPLKALLRRRRRPVKVDSDAKYTEIGIRSWGKGIFHKDQITGKNLGNKSVFWLEPGDFVLNIVFAWEGAIAVVAAPERGMIASHRFPTFRHAEDRVVLEYLLLVLQSDHGRSLMEFNSPGAAGRNKTIRIKSFMAEEIPLPPVAEQEEIVGAVREEEREIARLRSHVQRAIRLLREYRTALISAAVTGRIDVREGSQRDRSHRMS